ncbi:MAG: TIGR03752 family integrating conjugative element protein [Candidatus Thiodiazotropha endolucinida]
MYNKILLLLVIVVFVVLGSLVFYSGEDRPDMAETTGEVDQKDELPPLTDADRDTVANTIQTMSARNKELETRMAQLEKQLQAKDKQEKINARQFESRVNKTVEDRVTQLTTTFGDKLKDMRTKLSTLQSKSDSSDKAPSGMPKGLGFDDIPFKTPGSIDTRDYPGPMTLSGNNTVTIMPVTTIAMSGEGDRSVPVSIDGTPIDQGRDMSTSKRRKRTAVPENPPVPVYTIPQNATLFSNDTLTALVGIVPNLNGSVIDPIRFKVITGDINLATNRQFLPQGVKDIVWSGIAIGNREMSCVRGEVHSVTFTFHDGTIRTINSQTDSGKNVLGGKMLGYIATRQGNPCIPGTLITNAQDYLNDRMLASGAAALTSSFADTQRTTTQFGDGTTTSFFSGDEGKYIAGQTLAGSLSELTQYLRERQRNAVDLVYLDAGQDIVLHVESQIDIDYDPEGRKLNHALDATNQLSYRLD